MHPEDDGRPSDVITEADVERWRLALALAEQLIGTMPEGVVSISGVSDRAAALSAARVIYRSDTPTA